MTKDYFCQNTQRNLREKTNGFPIPQQSKSVPNPPAPIKLTSKPDPSYLHPPAPTRTRSVKKNQEVDQEPMKSADSALNPQPSSPPVIVRKTSEVVASSATCSTPVPISVHSVSSPDGTITSFRTFIGPDNNLAKKQNVEEQEYHQILNWKDGCPDFSTIPSTYEAFRNYCS